MDHLVVFSTLLITLFLFIRGTWRYDVVAILALLFLVVWGIVPAEEAFSGFSHPAVITVAAVLLISRALQKSGLVAFLAKFINKVGKNLFVQISVLCLVTAIASAFMNNIGALAILMPVAIQLARKNEYPVSYILMPISFASILGGMSTLIGTPPNIIIATFRSDYTDEAFGMFDFTPVGAIVALAGILFISLLGWKFLPKRSGNSSKNDRFEIENYITEVRITEESELHGTICRELSRDHEDEDIHLLGLVRDGHRMHAPSPGERLHTGDILILETDTESLNHFIERTNVELVGNEPVRTDAEGSDSIQMREAVIMRGSPLAGKQGSYFQRFGINLLAIARSDQRIRKRIRNIRLLEGDVLLLQGRSESIDDIIGSLKCLPLVERDLNIGKPSQLILAMVLFTSVIATVLLDFLPVQVAFSIGVVAMVVTGILPVKDIYEHIDWPIIILLGAMIPIGVAFETSGGADIVAQQILIFGTEYPLWMTIGFLIMVTMLLTDIINNAATVVLMAPVGITIANELGISADPVLMAIAIGASSAFLTPIGHQSNTLVMGPGGYKFSDYWRMGLPLDIIILILATPLILYFWPA
ncbi:MAG: SLC13 family permease [Bacteroidota bacterium]